jgi:hypothetical protein
MAVINFRFCALFLFNFKTALSAKILAYLLIFESLAFGRIPFVCCQHELLGMCPHKMQELGLIFGNFVLLYFYSWLVSRGSNFQKISYKDSEKEE